ncbi:MAG: cupin domain-containing protein [Actinomycetota bacterium]
MSTIQTPAFVREPGQGEALWVLGGLYTFKALAGETDGGCTVIEVRAPEGFAIPVHFHQHEEEGFYVAQGEVTFVLGSDVVRATGGSFAYAPRNLDHAFRFETADAKLILFFAPATPATRGCSGSWESPPLVPRSHRRQKRLQTLSGWRRLRPGTGPGGSDHLRRPDPISGKDPG